jgi:hypothetical protein
MAERPIGHWIKRFDQAATQALAATLANHGLTRVSWQALNTLAQQTISRAGLVDLLEPFVSPVEVETIVASLSEEGWIVLDDDYLVISESGRTHHDHVAALVHETRAASMKDIAQNDYDIALRTVKRMAENLEQRLTD